MSIGLALFLALRVAVVDRGLEAASPEARAAIETSLGKALVSDPEIEDALFGLSPEGRAKLAGAAALARARAAVQMKRCTEAEHELAEAEQKLGAVALVDSKEPTLEIYRLREECGGRFPHVLKPAPAGAPGGVAVRFVVDPSDAQVYVDGVELGPGAHLLPAGTHLLDVEKAGFRKWHRRIEVAAGGPAEFQVALAPLVPEKFADLRAKALGLRGNDAGRQLSTLSQIAARASADRLLLVEVAGAEVKAQIFDPDAGALGTRTFAGRISSGTVAGLSEFATGDPGIVIAKVKDAAEIRRKAANEDKTVWSHWYSWAIAGAVATTVIILFATQSSTSDDLNVRVVR